MSNEEKTLLDKISKPCYVESFSEREQYVIESLIKKSLLSKVYYKGNTVVIPNERP
jgi:uncharacterized FlgJ-related protein